MNNTKKLLGELLAKLCLLPIHEYEYLVRNDVIRILQTECDNAAGFVGISADDMEMGRPIGPIYETIEATLAGEANRRYIYDFFYVAVADTLEPANEEQASYCVKTTTKFVNGLRLRHQMEASAPADTTAQPVVADGISLLPADRMTIEQAQELLDVSELLKPPLYPLQAYSRFSEAAAALILSPAGIELQSDEGLWMAGNQDLKIFKEFRPASKQQVVNKDVSVRPLDQQTIDRVIQMLLVKELYQAPQSMRDFERVSEADAYRILAPFNITLKPDETLWIEGGLNVRIIKDQPDECELCATQPEGCNRCNP